MRKTQKTLPSAEASIVVVIENEIHRFKNSSGSIGDPFNGFELLIASHNSATSVALAAPRTLFHMTELNELGKQFD